MKQLLITYTAYCILSSANCIAQNVTVLRGPYLHVGTPNSMIVRWRTDPLTPVNSRVWYGLQPDTSTMTIIDSVTLTTEHEVKITGLTPNTRYFYAIGTSDTILAGPDSMQYFQTSPVPGTEQLIRVWATGDHGEGNSNQAAVRDAYKSYSNNQHTDVWMILGDNAYDDGTDSEYQTNHFDMYPEIMANTVLWPTPGNHDYGSTHPVISDPGVYFNNFTMPVNGEAGGVPSGDESYYSFDYGNVHFISLNSEDYTYTDLDIIPPCDATILHSQNMITWLQNDLASTDKEWIITFWHAVPYSEGTHSENYQGSDCFKQIEGAVMRSMRDNLVPILEDNGVDLILGGHSHNYERSYLIHGYYGPNSPYNADSIMVDSTSGSINPYIKYSTGPNPNLGTVYTVVGSSAKTGNYGSDGQLNHPLMYTGDYILGSMMIEINGNQLDAYFIDTSGTAFDEFTIVKCSSVASFSQSTDTVDIAVTGIVQFADNSINAEQWLWNFGDGNTDIVANPIHTYSSNGTFTITLIVLDGVCSDTATSTITVINATDIVDNKLINDIHVKFYPNPFSNNVQVEYTMNVSGSVSLKIYNLLGKNVYTIVDEKQESGKHIYFIDAASTGLAKGVYFLQLKSGERLNTKKIVKL